MAQPHANEFELVPCCQHLRTKMQFCRGADMRAGPGYVEVSDTATYWCNRTSTSFGPDDAPGTPESCQPNRTCYQRDV